MTHLLAGALSLQVCALLPHSGDPNPALPTCTASILPTETSSQSTSAFLFCFVFKVTKMSMLPKQGFNNKKKDRKCPQNFFLSKYYFLISKIRVLEAQCCGMLDQCLHVIRGSAQCRHSTPPDNLAWIFLSLIH